MSEADNSGFGRTFENFKPIVEEKHKPEPEKKIAAISISPKIHEEYDHTLESFNDSLLVNRVLGETI